MIFKLKEWTENLIIATIISVIIEMLVPEGNNKKYVKVITGIYILFIILNPLLELFDVDFSFNDFFNTSTIETSNIQDNTIREIYIIGIEEKIKSDLSEKNINTKKIKIEFDSNYENITRIYIEIFDNTAFEEVYKYFEDNYSLEKQNIDLRGI